MRKAKDYAAEYNQAETLEEKTEAINRIFQSLLVELQEITQERKPQSNRAVWAIFKQQEEKWDVIARRTDLKSGTFLYLLQRTQPQLHKIYTTLQEKGDAN